jgi:predicted dithiol-disulfide oxidoreductase (DUF899 family)
VGQGRRAYLFEGPNGRETLADLFDGRSQLIVQHFMFGPGWKEGCVGRSFSADHMNGALPHLEHHDVSFVVVARAPLNEITPFHKRMGWRFKWVSSYGSDFNYDYHVSFTKEEIAKGKVFYNFEPRDFQSEEMSGRSVFYKDAAGGEWTGKYVSLLSKTSVAGVEAHLRGSAFCCDST